MMMLRGDYLFSASRRGVWRHAKKVRIGALM